jgi:magnesium-transporting ATPase (P-type)
MSCRAARAPPPLPPLLPTLSQVKGSKTEGAGIALVESFGFEPEAIRAAAAAAGTVLQQFSFSSERKMMSTIVALTPAGADGPVRMFTTGGSDYILARSTSVLSVS